MCVWVGGEGVCVRVERRGPGDTNRGIVFFFFYLEI